MEVWLRSTMDSMWVSGTQDPGSIPGGATISVRYQYIPFQNYPLASARELILLIILVYLFCFANFNGKSNVHDPISNQSQASQK